LKKRNIHILEQWVWLPYGEKILNISLFILTEYTNMPDTQMDRWMDRHCTTA